MTVLASATSQGLQAQLHVEMKDSFAGDVWAMRQLLNDGNNCKELLELVKGPVQPGQSYVIPFNNQKIASTSAEVASVALKALRPAAGYKIEGIQLSIGAYTKPTGDALATALGTIEIEALKNGTQNLGGSTMHRSIALAVVINSADKLVSCGQELDGQSVCNSLGGTWDLSAKICRTDNLVKPGTQAGFCMHGWMGLEFDSSSVVAPAYADTEINDVTELSGCKCEKGWVLRPTGYPPNPGANNLDTPWLKGLGRNGLPHNNGTAIAYNTCFYMPNATCRQKYPFNHATLFPKAKYPDGMPTPDASPCPY
jgi:hypothetical protein